MKKLVLIITLLSTKLYAYSIQSSQRVQTYEMQTCVQGESVSGCHGILMHDVVLKDFLGRETRVDHLFFRNLRGEDGPVSSECLEAYVNKINKYVGHPEIMKNFARRSRAKWSDPEDGSMFTFPSHIDHTDLDNHDSAYGLPKSRNSEFYFKNQDGLECSFTISMEDHAEDLSSIVESSPLKEEEESTLDDNDSASVVVASDDDFQEELIEDEDRPDQGIVDIANPECDPDSAEPLDQEVVDNIEELGDVAAAVYETSQLLRGDLTYGPFGMDAAKANVYLETYGDEITSISLEGLYNILGMEGSIVQTVAASQLLTGGSIGFAVDSESNPILKLTPGENFSSTEGGPLRFEFWDGRQYKMVDSELRRDENGEFNMFIVNERGAQPVNYLSVNVRGMSPSGMRVNDYEVSNR